MTLDLTEDVFTKETDAEAPGISREAVCQDDLIDILKFEIQPAMGCTEVGAAALAAAKAAETLGAVPETLTVAVSANIYKNGVFVGIPGTRLKGLVNASALGALIGDSRAGLNVLDGVTTERIAQAEDWIRAGGVSVTYDPDAPDTVYLRTEASAAGHTAVAIIQSRHSHIAEVSYDGKPLVSAEAGMPEEEGGEAALGRLGEMDVCDILRRALEMDVSKIAFLLEAARTNDDAAATGSADPASDFGPALSRLNRDLPGLSAAVGKVQSRTGGASEARMRGLPVPIMSLSSSGNHGITTFLGVYAFAQERGIDDERTIRALAVAALIAIYIKVQTGRLTAYCGCAIAPATGVAAATVYLMGGDVETMVRAMQSVIGTFSGMLCDGAKLSCAYKVSTVAASAIQFALLALDGAFIPAGDGIVGRTIEETVRNLGTLNDPGMKQTDRVVLGLLQNPEPAPEA